jgi:hypothetical protein
MWRAVAAGVSVVAAAAIGVVTALVTAHPSRGLWVALGALVIVGAALQTVVTLSERRSRERITASGAGAVAVGGSAGEIHTRVHGKAAPVGRSAGDGVDASGAGAVGVGGDAAGPISTDVRSPEV